MRRIRALLRALSHFVEGFAGLAPLGRDPEAVRHALAERAAGRRSCC